jgi:hypothetical protein
LRSSRSFKKQVLVPFLVGLAAGFVLSCVFVPRQEKLVFPHEVHICGPVEKDRNIRITLPPEKEVFLVTDNVGNILEWYPDPEGQAIWVKMPEAVPGKTSIFLYWAGDA